MMALLDLHERDDEEAQDPVQRQAPRRQLHEAEHLGQERHLDHDDRQMSASTAAPQSHMFCFFMVKSD